MESCPSSVELQQFLDGTLDTESCVRVDRHIESCLSCQKSLDVFTKDDVPDRRDPDGPQTAAPMPQHLRGDIVKRILDEPNITPKPSGSGSKRRKKDSEECAMPSRIGDFEILHEIGRGGMGIVFAACQESLGRVVALKVLPQQRFPSETSVARFRREARSASRLHHTNIVPIFEVGEDQGVQYFTMQLIDGTSLSRFEFGEADIANKSTNREPLPTVGDVEAPIPVEHSKRHVESVTFERPPPVPVQDRYEFMAETGMQIASALAHAHERGIIHRDVKPSNILLDQQGVAWLADFGLAKQMDDNLTGSLEAPGTLRFMAPERFRGVSDEQSDIYSLGATLYEVLAGSPAFSDTDRISLMQQIGNAEPKQLRTINPSIPRDLQTIVSTAMAKDPARRYSAASDMAEDLRRYLASEPIRARRVSFPERLWLWAKKERALATSLAAVLALMVAATIGSMFAVQEQTRLAQEKAEETKKAEEQRDAAFQNAYFADMKTAHDDWHNGHTHRMLKTLKQHVPTDSSQKDLRDWEWYYLLSLAHRDGKTILDHDGQVLQVRWSPDGERIYSASTDGTLGVWTAEGESVERIKIPGLARFAVSPNGDQIATVSGDPVVRIWNATTFELVTSVQVDLPSTSLVDWSPQGHRVAVSTQRECQPVILDTTTWQVETKLAQIRRCDLLTFSPNGEWIAYGYTPTNVWSFSENKVVYTVDTWNLRGISLAWSPDSRQFVIGDVSRGCHLFELDEELGASERFQRTRVFMESTTVSSMAFHHDGRYLLAGDHEQRVSLINLETWQTDDLFRGHLDFVSSLDWHPSGKRAVSAGLDGAIKIWPVQSLGTLADSENTDSTAQTNDRGTSPDGMWYWEVTNGETLVSNSKTGEVVATLPEPNQGHPYRNIRFFPQWNRVIFNNNYTIVESWNTETWQQEGRWNYLSLSKGVQITDDTICMVQGGWNTPPWHITLIDVRTLKPRTFLPHHQVWKALRSTDLGIRLNPAATRLLTASCGEVKIWDTSTLTELHTVVGHVPGSEMYSGVWSSTGKYVASRGSDHTAKIWDAETGRLVTDIRGHQAGVGYIQFSEDDARVLTVGYYAKLWDVESGREILTTNNKESPAGKHSHDHLLSDFDTPLIREFYVQNSKSNFNLPDYVLNFEGLEKAVRHRRKADDIERFQHASLHDLARSLVSRPMYDRYDPVRGLPLAEQAVALNPGNSDYHWTLALAQIRNEKYEAAVESAKTAAVLAPEKKLRSDVLIAYGELMLGRDRVAHEVYSRVATGLQDGQEFVGVERFVFREVAQRLVADSHRPSKSDTTIFVNTLRDEIDGSANGKTSLREAVWIAAPGERIEFSVHGEIELRHGPIEINQAVEIVGPGADQLTVRASPDARIFTVQDSDRENRFRFELSGMRLTGGRQLWSSVTADVSPGLPAETAPSAADALIRGLVLDPKLDYRAGAIVSTEDIEIRSVLFDNNVASSGGALSLVAGSKTLLQSCAFRNNGHNVEIYGGAISAAGGESTHLHVVGCEFSGNMAMWGGAVAFSCDAIFENCTFSGNHASSASTLHMGIGGSADVIHCTFTDNHGPSALSSSPIGSPLAIRFTNSIVTDNLDEQGRSSPLCKNSSEANGITAEYCILDASENIKDLGNNLFDVEPLLGPLADNGGLPRTHALLKGSPAIDAGTAESQSNADRETRDL